MELEQIAQAILYGTRLEDKLVFDEKFTDSPSLPALAEAPEFPGRPPELQNVGRAEFPKVEALADPRERGRLLHFFANHELLALELMALVLLKFPDAPAGFRAGVAFTMRDEQNHLRLYLERMRALGVEFGELPVNHYFWNAMRDMTSPLQFVMQMGLTLEQANLDFSLYFQRAVADVGDSETAAILERVYREEIDHVKHGVTWFNRLRTPQEESDWEAYLRLLPPPMTPGRAKGRVYVPEARVAAGLSKQFVRELEVYGGSKGRPPVLWMFNPQCEAEVARATVGFTPPKKIASLALDLETLPMFAARQTDVVLVRELPRAEWLKGLRDLEFPIPEFRRVTAEPREKKIAGMEPWGWSPASFALFQPWRDRLIPIEGANNAWCGEMLARADFAATGIGKYFAKTWSTEYSRAKGDIAAGRVFTNWEAARAEVEAMLARGERVLSKAPYGTAGAQNKRVLKVEELDTPIGGWIKKTIEIQGAIVIERWLDKVTDLSMQIEVRAEDVRLVGARQFFTGAQLEYRGTYLDQKLRNLTPEALRFMHQGGAMESWRAFATELGERLRAEGYRGPAGLDAMIWRDGDALRLKPLVELNPRWTMGRIALELENHVHPAARAAWLFFRKKEEIKTSPVVFRSGRIVDGTVFTNDPHTAREVVTVLAVGDALAKVGCEFCN